MRFKELICLFMSFLNCYTIQGDNEKLSLHMPGVRPRKPDSYICTSLKVPAGDLYIVTKYLKNLPLQFVSSKKESLNRSSGGLPPVNYFSDETDFNVKYEPEAHKETAHHMLLFGCGRPGSYKEAWNCGGMGSGTCRGSESILFGWARDAPSLQLPKDVGFKIGGRTSIQYLTLQIHYSHALEADNFDRSGLTLQVTTAPQPNVASIYLLLANSAYIPPHSKGTHVDIACKYNSEQEINAFAFRTHAHDLGRVITAYRIRNGTWKLLGKGDPHAPQAFYPMSNVTTIKKGDILAARCTFDSDRTTATTIGSTASDEMCNFYMMYYRDASSNIKTPEICLDQYTYENLYKSFPNGSDVALPSAPGHHHHHHHGQHSNLEGETAVNKTTNVVLDSEEPGMNQVPATSSPDTEEHVSTAPITITDNDQITISKHVISNEDNVTSDRPTVEATTDQHARELVSGIPAQETTQSTPFKTSRSAEHDVTGDITTSTSVSEQTTRPSDVLQDKSTRLNSKVSTNKDLMYPRTTRSTEESNQASLSGDKRGQQSLVNSSKSEDKKEFNVSLVDAWPSSVTEGLGQVTGLAVDSAGRLFVFHRSERIWDFDTFNMDNTFRSAQTRGPIRGATILILDGSSGEVLEKHGKNMFYLPHGLTIDHGDNVWITDVGRHQVMKFSRGEFKTPSLVLGESLVPGSGYKHFCKPTDVAVEKSGVFYVSDGYCNGRIMKFSPEGGLMKVWGRPSNRNDLLPNTFDIPHSLALDEKRNMIYVADRENGRIQCFDTHGKFHKQISSKKFGGLVFAIDFNNQDDVLYAVNSGGRAKVQGFTINPSTGKIISSWSPHGQGFSQPHAVVSNGSNVFVAEIGPNRVWKFEHQSPVTSNDQNFARGLNAAVVNSNPTRAPGDSHTGSDDKPREKAQPSNRPGVIILAILSVPVLILLVVGVVSRLRQRNRRIPKYDMMDASLGNYSVSKNWCNSMNCCNRQYRNMEELYLMDSDSDLEIYPDVHVNKK